jgi:[acyl-carrier-protein] S-malonyltransferase
MGKALWEASPDVRRLFHAGSDLLGFDVEEICFQGPKERLNTTLYTQPVLFIVTVAVFRIFQEETASPVDFVAGHSLGEYAALVAAGSLAFEDGLRIVKKRAALMQESVPPGTGGMAAVMGLEPKEVEEICLEASNGEALVPANFNAPNQIVVSGAEAALARAIDLIKERGGKPVRLPVSAPFHSPLMVPASEKLGEAVRDVFIEDPVIPWVSNVTASPVEDKDECRRLLPLQVRSPVMWEASVRRMLESGVTRFIELGPGKVLKGLCRRIDSSIACQNAETPDEVRALA